jgi:hypothetical protein
MASTTTHTQDGHSAEVSGSEILYFVDFDEGAGDGTALLEVLLDGSWVPADEEYTASMLSARVTDIIHQGERTFRWRVTVSSGSIKTILSKN